MPRQPDNDAQSKHLHIRMTAGWHRRLRVVAAHADETLQAIGRRAVRDYIRRYEDAQHGALTGAGSSARPVPVASEER